ncbi:hypothetical protein DFP72DRAFT_798942 [Ephemerocybe angulata]|uniref:Uncharacterized protein n=1 Tax=Ephemerocybe angulata TaxID=980116 RepID=A0A8H6IGM5_9AGAR|nr:hypothetical protein DFP72DRAFT_798942 [Tulosesus angulatus]
MVKAAADLTQLSPKTTSLHTTSANSLVSPSFTPLPPLPSFTSNTLLTTTANTQTTLVMAPLVSSASGNNGPDKPKLGTPLIVLLSIGIVCLALGSYLVSRFLCRRRKRAARIIPSLPILEKEHPYDEAAFNRDGRESPVFGGKERSASRLGVEGPLWTWVQYAKPTSTVIPNQRSSLSQPVAEGEDSLVLAPDSQSLARQSIYDNQGNFSTPFTPAPRRQSLTLSKKRASTSSLYRPRESREIGVAITGDTHSILERSRSKLARRSQSYSVLGDRRRRDSVYRPETAYDGADVSSPTTYYQPVTTPGLAPSPVVGKEGRARIQSSYYAVAPYPRLSSMPPSYSIGTARKVHISNAYATSERRTTEQASAELAESQYAPASPGATLYPDDSMSVIAAARQKRRSQSEVKRQSRHLGTEGSKGLLEMDFGVSRMSLSDLAEGALTSDDNHTQFQSNSYSHDSHKPLTRGQDRPPRVPSPPPLPSLTQMGLAHSNPEAYGNYRSPTYSIYGLYGNDRKSHATNIG